MTIRIKSSVEGVWTRRTQTLGTEETRIELEDETGAYLGTIVYMRRRHTKGGSTYGWRPEKSAANSRLTTMQDAIRKVVNS